MGAAVQAVSGEVGDFLGTNPKRLNTAGYDPSAQERAFVDALMLRSQGQGGPSVSNLLLQQGLNQSNADAMSLAASQRGVNPALAARLASQQQGNNQMRTNQQAGILGAQEQLNTDQILGGMFGSQRQSAGQANALQANSDAVTMGRRGDLVSSAGNMITSIFSGGGGGGGGGMYNGGQVPESGGFAEAIGAHAAQKIMMGDAHGMIPGEAEVPGDHPKNDKVHIVASPGEVIIPRTVVAMGPEAMAAFAEAVSKRSA